MRTLLLTVLLLAVPRVVLACPVCFGQNETPLGNAIKAGVILMLVLVGLVLAGFAAFIVNLNRRARMFSDVSNPQKGTP
jgi:maltodextrin utilization protein YvdJ